MVKATDGTTATRLFYSQNEAWVYFGSSIALISLACAGSLLLYRRRAELGKNFKYYLAVITYLLIVADGVQFGFLAV